MEGFNTIYGCAEAYPTATQPQSSDTSNISRETATFVYKNKLFFSDDIFDGFLLLGIIPYPLET